MGGNCGERVKEIRCFRHTLASFLVARGNSPVLIKNLLRWSEISMLDTYEITPTGFDVDIVPWVEIQIGSVVKGVA
jgi:hypothetical protein